MSQEVSMVQECVDSYIVDERDDGSIKITIDVPKRFADLWLVKLSELRTQSEEIAEYDTETDGGASR